MAETAFFLGQALGTTDANGLKSLQVTKHVPTILVQKLGSVLFGFLDSFPEKLLYPYLPEEAGSTI